MIVRYDSSFALASYPKASDVAAIVQYQLLIEEVSHRSNENSIGVTEITGRSKKLKQVCASPPR
jgi:hypothetical protein